MRSCSILFLVTIFSLHCATPIELEFESDYVPKVTVFTEFSPDSIWSVQLIQSVAYTDSVNWEQYAIDDASVTIHSSLDIVQPMVYMSNGRYISPSGQAPFPNTRYTITVQSVDFPSVNGSSEARSFETELTEIQEISSADTTIRSFRVRLRIDDPPGQDYYSLHLDYLYRVCRGDEQQIDTTWALRETRLRSAYFDSDFAEMRESVSDVNDPSVLPVVDESNGFSHAYFNDRTFEGTSKTINLIVRLPQDQLLEPHIRVTIKNWSNELWSYQEYLELVDLYGPNYFEETPKAIYSNINGGLGVFGGKYSRHLRVDDQGESWDNEDLKVVDQFIPACNQR